MKKTEPEYYPPVENLLDLIFEPYKENNPVEKNTVVGKTAKAKGKGCIIMATLDVLEKLEESKKKEYQTT